jgi:hypothetical protein
MAKSLNAQKIEAQNNRFEQGLSNLRAFAAFIPEGKERNQFLNALSTFNTNDSRVQVEGMLEAFSTQNAEAAKRYVSVFASFQKATEAAPISANQASL